MLERDKKWGKLSNMRTTSEGLEELPNYEQHQPSVTIRSLQKITNSSLFCIIMITNIIAPYYTREKKMLPNEMKKKNVWSFRSCHFLVTSAWCEQLMVKNSFAWGWSCIVLLEDLFFDGLLLHVAPFSCCFMLAFDQHLAGCKMVELQLLHEVGKLMQSVSTLMVLGSGMLSGPFFCQIFTDSWCAWKVPQRHEPGAS